MTLYADKVSRLFVCAVVCKTHRNRKEKQSAEVRDFIVQGCE